MAGWDTLPIWKVRSNLKPPFMPFITGGFDIFGHGLHSQLSTPNRASTGTNRARIARRACKGPRAQLGPNLRSQRTPHTHWDKQRPFSALIPIHEHLQSSQSLVHSQSKLYGKGDSDYGRRRRPAWHQSHNRRTLFRFFRHDPRKSNDGFDLSTPLGPQCRERRSTDGQWSHSGRLSL